MFRSLLLFALAAGLWAQESSPAVPPGKAAKELHVMAQFYELRVARIQQSLGLPPDRAKALAERWGRWDREFMDRGRQMMQLRTQFSQILLGPGSEEEKNLKAKPLVDKFMELRRQQGEAKQRFEADLLQTLPPAQQARMILLVEDVQSRIREILRDVRRSGGKI